MSKYTQAPWELIHFGGPQIGHKASGEAVCTMWGDENDPADPFHANARLIAAAPDLYEALKELFDSYKQLADSGDAGNWFLEDQAVGKKALSALSKVRG